MPRNKVAKTLDDGLASVCKELNVQLKDIKYTIIKESNGLFNKKVEFEYHVIDDVKQYLASYLKEFLDNMELESEIETDFSDGYVRAFISTNNNPLIIGKGANTLRALNVLARQAVCNEFKCYYGVYLDIDDYRANRYEKVEEMAKRIAKTVMRTKIAAKLDPMPNDERKVIHAVLGEYPNIKTQSFGEGKDRHLEIMYVKSKNND